MSIKSGHYVSDWAERKRKDPSLGCWCTHNAERPGETPTFVCGVCHVVITAGRLHFQPDCTHGIKGVVPMQAPPSEEHT